MVNLRVTSIQRFCIHDGDGIRTTVFLKGCPLRCKWCHNPETQRGGKEIFFHKNECALCRACEKVCPKGVHSFNEDSHFVDFNKCIGCGLCQKVCNYSAVEVVGKDKTLIEVIEEVKKDMPFYGKKGGLTISGGEPMIYEKEVFELCKKAKENSIRTCIETSGYFSSSAIYKLKGLVDCYLWDIKDTIDISHKESTGISNELIQKNLFLADELGEKTVMRCIMVKGVNTDKKHLDGIATIFNKLKHCKRVEIFSCRDWGAGKYLSLGRPNLIQKEWSLSIFELKQIQKYLKSLFVKCKITGI